MFRLRMRCQLRRVALGALLQLRRHRMPAYVLIAQTKRFSHIAFLHPLVQCCLTTIILVNTERIQRFRHSDKCKLQRAQNSVCGVIGSSVR